ncbi:MAG: FMN-binding protein [Bacteroidota bacterium]
MESTKYVVGFTLAMTILVALVLSSLFYGTKGQVAQNEDVFNKRAILSAIQNKLDKPVGDFSDEEVLALFDQKMEQITLDMDGEAVEGLMAEDVDMAQEAKKAPVDRVLPLFVYNGNGEKTYIVSVRGSGLWDAIWGNIALQSDFNTVVGAAFDHAGETPGLGAEIKDNPGFSKQFTGKKIYKDGEYVSINVSKSGVKDLYYDVDGISGATVTADGVGEMLYRGIKYYEPYFEKVRG